MEYSTDGVGFSALAGAPSSFAQVTGSPAGPEIFNFASVVASHFRLQVLSNYGDNSQTGFAEIGFDGAEIPEPGTIAITLLGLCALAVRQRLIS